MGKFPYMAPRTVQTVIGAVTASESPAANIFVAPCDCVIEGVGLVCGDEITLHATNFANVVVQNVTPATARTVASLTTETGEATANAIATDTYEALHLAATDSFLELEEDEVLQVEFTESGTPGTGDLTEAAMVVRWVPGQGAGQ